VILLLEKANRPLHMAAFIIFQKPKEQQTSFGPRLFDAYRHSQAVKPFNYKLKWLGKDVAAWETVEQLHPAGAPMVAFHGLPILPPGAGLNITFASVITDICLGIGAAPEAVHEPFRLAQLIEEAFHKLQVEAGGTAPRTARRPDKPA
jgi:hypothetical protein